MGTKAWIGFLLLPLFLAACAGGLPEEAKSFLASTTSLKVAPKEFYLPANATQQLTVTGGTAPYQLAVASGQANPDSSHTTVQAVSGTSDAEIRVSDSTGASTLAHLIVIQTFGWVQSGFGSCSATCGGGTQTQTVVCKDASGATVADSNCASLTKPATSQACGTDLCPAQTITLDTGSAACGNQQCSCGAYGTPDSSAALAVCKQLGFQSLISFSTESSTVGVTQCGAGGTGCFSSTDASYLICRAVTCQ